MIDYVRKNYGEIRQAVTTNGYISKAMKEDPLKLEIVNQSIDEFDISLDYADLDKHNEFRGQKKAGTWAIDTLKYCKSAQKEATIVCLGSKKNMYMENIDGLFKIAAKYNAKLRINIYRPTEGLNDFSRQFIWEPQDLVNILYAINDKYKILAITSAFMILNDALTVGLFYVFNKYFNNMIDCISNIFQERLNIRNFLPGFEKIKGHYELESEQEEKILYSIRNRKHSYLSFKDVSFSYANYSVLKDLNIKFESGKMNVIVGENGVGKTTLMDLILRFYNAQKGRIEYGGMDITQYDLKNWRKQIGYVLQDTMIFEGSLKDNILLYAPEASEQHIWNALKIAGLYDTVLQWELKLDTDLLMGERLSHGQRQRVAIARIAAKDSEIILMDEPTANLDYETEQTIISDIKKICNEKILIVITHRENIVRNADRIFVLKDGNVLATGQHEELLETCNYYKNLFDL